MKRATDSALGSACNAEAVHRRIFHVIEDDRGTQFGLGDFEPHVVQRQAADVAREQRVGGKTPAA